MRSSCGWVPAVAWTSSWSEGRQELFADLEPVDRLKFKDKRKYRDRLTAAQKSTGEKDAPSHAWHAERP